MMVEKHMTTNKTEATKTEAEKTEAANETNMCQKTYIATRGFCYK